MSNIDFSVTSDLENLISQAKFERIFFYVEKKKNHIIHLEHIEPLKKF